MEITKQRICGQVFWQPVFLLPGAEYHRCIFFDTIHVSGSETRLSYCTLLGMVFGTPKVKGGYPIASEC